VIWDAETVYRTLERYLVRKPAQAGGFVVPPGEVERIVARVVDVLTHSRFRRGPKPRGKDREAIERKVRYYVRRSRPVGITLGFGPIKNPNASERNRAEWAEAFAFHQMARLDAAVQEVYPPGLRVRVVCDDGLVHWVNRVPYSMTREYIASLRDLVGRLDLAYLIKGVVPLSRYQPILHLGLFFVRAERRVKRWEADPANREAIERMDLHAFKNLPPTPGLSESERWARAREASHRYRVYWEALEMSRLPHLQRPLMALYSGERGLLRLYSLCKGNVTQPWQGEGCLKPNEKGELVPFVLTQERKGRYRTQWVNGIRAAQGLLDRIRVVEPENPS